MKEGKHGQQPMAEIAASAHAHLMSLIENGGSSTLITQFKNEVYAECEVVAEEMGDFRYTGKDRIETTGKCTVLEVDTSTSAH